MSKLINTGLMIIALVYYNTSYAVSGIVNLQSCDSPSSECLVDQQISGIIEYLDSLKVLNIKRAGNQNARIWHNGGRYYSVDLEVYAAPTKVAQNVCDVQYQKFKVLLACSAQDLNCLINRDDIVRRYIDNKILRNIGQKLFFVQDGTCIIQNNNLIEYREPRNITLLDDVYDILRKIAESERNLSDESSNFTDIQTEVRTKFIEMPFSYIDSINSDIDSISIFYKIPAGFHTNYDGFVVRVEKNCLDMRRGIDSSCYSVRKYSSVM